MLKMIFHSGYWDYPFDGLAEYNGQEVYYQIADEPARLQPPYPQEVMDALQGVEMNDDLDMDLKEYWIYYDEGLRVERKLSYYVYKVPSEILETYKHEFMTWSDHIGWHCWHDDRHRPMNTIHPDPGFNQERFYRERQRIKMDINDFELIGKFQYDLFQNFSTP